MWYAIDQRSALPFTPATLKANDRSLVGYTDDQLLDVIDGVATEAGRVIDRPLVRQGYRETVTLANPEEVLTLSAWPVDTPTVLCGGKAIDNVSATKAGVIHDSFLPWSPGKYLIDYYAGWIFKTQEFAWDSNVDIDAGTWLQEGGTYYVCDLTGTTGNQRPTFDGAEVTDGTVIWRARDLTPLPANLYLSLMWACGVWIRDGIFKQHPGIEFYGDDSVRIKHRAESRALPPATIHVLEGYGR